jgi:hypothetical protein
MGATLTNGALRSHEKSRLSTLDGIDLRPAKVRAPERTEEIAPKRKRAGKFTRDAMRSAGLSVEAFRIDAQQKSGGVVSEALSDEGARSVSLDWVLDQTDLTFRIAFTDALMKEWGLQDSKSEARREAVVRLFSQLLALMDETRVA